MMADGTKSYRRAGFVLIELIIAISIISLLAAVMYPVVQRARREAKRDVCLSNLRQLGTAITMYCADYDDLLPRAPDARSHALALDGKYVYGQPEDRLIASLPDIRTALEAYGTIHQIFHCPMDFVSREMSRTQQAWFSAYGSSYTWNEQKGLHGKKLADFRNPSEGMLMWDTMPFHSDHEERVRRRSCVFADTRVRTLSEPELQKLLMVDP